MKSLINQRVPVAPSVSLAADVHLPSGKGPFPTLIMRSPYHRDRHQIESVMHLVKNGYAFVTQDCRGKYDSDGVFTPLVDEAADGQATVDWVANQKWCNGRIGLWGRSYPGIVTAEDTDFIAKLCVEEPSGDLTVLAMGSIRCKYRNSWSGPEPLVPGEATSIRIDLGGTAYVFPAGSRVALLLTSSDFPRILPHANTLDPPFASRPITAHQAVLHGPGVESVVQLPVVEGLV